MNNVDTCICGVGVGFHGKLLGRRASKAGLLHLSTWAPTSGLSGLSYSLKYIQQHTWFLLLGCQ